jgi:pimeloyl-ACP methyl ester carboxylesterase
MTSGPQELTELRVAVRGAQARYRVGGEGEPVLLVHGIGRSLEDWTEQHAVLGRGYRVLSVDLPGFGRSEPLREPYSLPALASFLDGFLDAVGVDGPVHLVGNSLGGAVVMQLSVQAPHRARSLVLVNSAGFGREVALALRLLAVRPLGRPEWRDALLAQVAAAGVPALVVWGDKDLILPHAHLSAARQHLPHARFHLFQDTGHMPQVERAEELAALMTDFWTTST